MLFDTDIAVIQREAERKLSNCASSKKPFLNHQITTSRSLHPHFNLKVLLKSEIFYAARPESQANCNDSFFGGDKTGSVCRDFRLVKTLLTITKAETSKDLHAHLIMQKTKKPTESGCFLGSVFYIYRCIMTSVTSLFFKSAALGTEEARMVCEDRKRYAQLITLM